MSDLHTDGPWQLLGNGGEPEWTSGSLIIVGPESDDLATVHSNRTATVSITWPEAVANGVLMKEAPNLLAALRDAVTALEMISNIVAVERRQVQQPTSVLGLARAAIVKATGG